MESIPKYFFQKYIQKKVLHHADYLLAGTSEKKIFINERCSPNKIFINPETGYDEKIFENGENLRKCWGLKEDDFIVMYAGRLVKEKGIKIILSPAEKLESINDKIKFIFVGKGYLEKTIKNFKSKNIFYKGSYDFTEMGKVLRTCNIFIYPSIKRKYWVEQFGYSVIEGIVCQKPAIVSNSGSLPNFIQEGINGSIIKERNESELKAKILWWFHR